MSKHGPHTTGTTLRQAASLVFALTSVVPLLIFTYSLITLDALGKARYQINLVLALAVSLLGFHLSRIIMGRMTELLRSLSHTPDTPDVPTVPTREQLQVPGIGVIQEFHEVRGATDVLAALWKNEARAHVGQPVRIAVRNAIRPVTGLLIEAGAEGVRVEVDGQEVAIAYARFSSITAPIGESDTPLPPKAPPRDGGH
ncbi:MAG: hypothetical protein HY294_07845 [Candidatus Rokubacteria bacterium]|nr:hypothetical protein [Candidatus Rokubacteria bacterium]